MKKTKKFIASLALVAMVATMAPMNAFAATGVTTDRLSGADRFGTAIAVAEKFVSATTAVLAPAADANLVDALAAAPLAGKTSPILLSDNDSLTEATKAELIKLGVTKVYVVGALKQAVVDQVNAIPGVTAVALKGDDRIATAAKINEQLVSPAGTFVVGYYALADALSVASFAAANNYAIVVANVNGTLPASSILVGSKTYLVGGPTLVSDIAGATRLAGADRFATNKVVLDTLGYSYSNVYVANGTQAHLVDSLSASSLAAKSGAPIVLTDTATGGDAALASVGLKLAANAVVTALGGATVVSNATVAKVIPAIPAVLAVSSVSAINAKQVQVVFNKDVDDTTLGSILVTAQGSATVSGGLTYDLGDDNKTLTITAANTLTQKGYYRVDVTGVQDTAKNTINPYSSVIQLNDATAPSIIKTSAVASSSSTMTFKVYFSEPVQMDMVKVGSVVAGATPNATYSDTYTVTLPASADALVAGQTYPVTVNGLRDYAGNYASATVSTSVTVVQDQVKPTFSVVAVSPTQFNVVFDKDMNAAVAVDSITVKDTTAAKNVLSLASLPTWKSDKRTLKVTLATTPIASGDTSANITVTVQNLKDVPGNTVAKADTTLTLAKETVNPTVTGIRFLPNTNNKIEVTFSEYVSGIAIGDFVLTDSDKAIADTFASVSAIDSNNKVVLTLTNGVSSTDTYTLALKVNSVVDASGNNNDAVALTLSYSAAAAAQLTATITNTYDGTNPIDSTSAKRIVYINFNQADVVNGISNTTGNYKTGAADNKANYTIDGAALPTGTVVTFVNGTPDAVKLDFSAITDTTKLPAALVNGGDVVVTVSNVQTLAGSTIQYTSTQVAVVDATAPTLKSAFLTGTEAGGYTVTLVMSEKISATAAGDFILMVGATVPAIDTCTVSSSDATKILITVSTAAEAAKIAVAPTTLTIETTVGAITTADQATVAKVLAPIAHANAIAVTNYSN